MEEAVIRAGSIIKNPEEIGFGDILVESVTFEDDGYVEIGRYLVVGKLIEVVLDEPYQIEAHEITYFKTVLLYVGREHDSTWARRSNPLDKYHLSEHEVTNYHDWSYAYKAGLSWPIDSIEVEESGTKWEEPGY